MFDSMTYGENGMLRARWHRGLVLLQRPLAAAFPRKRKGRWEVRVYFLESSTSEMFQVVWLKGKEIPRADTKLLEEMVIAHRSEILEEWEGKVQPQ